MFKTLTFAAAAIALIRPALSDEDKSEIVATSGDFNLVAYYNSTGYPKTLKYSAAKDVCLSYNMTLARIDLTSYETEDWSHYLNLFYANGSDCATNDPIAAWYKDSTKEEECSCVFQQTFDNVANFYVSYSNSSLSDQTQIYMADYNCSSSDTSSSDLSLDINNAGGFKSDDCLCQEMALNEGYMTHVICEVNEFKLCKQECYKNYDRNYNTCNNDDRRRLGKKKKKKKNKKKKTASDVVEDNTDDVQEEASKDASKDAHSDSSDDADTDTDDNDKEGKRGEGYKRKCNKGAEFVRDFCFRSCEAHRTY